MSYSITLEDVIFYFRSEEDIKNVFRNFHERQYSGYSDSLADFLTYRCIDYANTNASPNPYMGENTRAARAGHDARAHHALHGRGPAALRQARHYGQRRNTYQRHARRVGA